MSNSVKKMIHSEQIEPAFAHIIGVLFKDCEEADTTENNWDLEDKCQCLWRVVRGMRHISLAIDNHKVNHFSVTTTNHTKQIAKYIEKRIGINPLKEWKW